MINLVKFFKDNILKLLFIGILTKGKKEVSISSAIKTTVWKYYAFNFFKGGALFSAVLVPFYTDWGGISLFQIQILQSWFMLWIFIMEVPTGAVADFFGRKYSIGFGAFLVSVATLVYGSVSNFYIFLLGEFLFAIAVALMSGADDALLYDSLKEAGKEDENKKYMGRARSFELGGILVGSIVGSLVITKLPLNYPMLLSSIPYFIAGFIALSIKEPKIRAKVSESKRYLVVLKKGFTFFYRHKTLRIMAFDAVMVSAAAYFVIWFYQPLLKNAGVPMFYFGFFHAFLVTVQIVISSQFEWLEKRIGGGQKLISFGALVTATSFILVGIFPILPFIVLLIILAGGFGLTRMGLITSYMNKFIPSEERATVLSSISMFRRFALVIVNPIMGFVADKSLSAALLLVAILPLLVFAFSPLEKEMVEEE